MAEKHNEAMVRAVEAPKAAELAYFEMRAIKLMY